MENLWIWIVIILLVIAIILQAVSKKPASTKEPEQQEEKAGEKAIQYKKKAFLTANERSFLANLRGLSAHNLRIIPQINLATIVQKVGEFRWQNELYRNIDFGVFDKEYNLLLLIELNDSSHQQPTRQRRDSRVKDIVSQADIKLITFYTDKPNKAEYIEKRILNEISKSS